MVRNPYYYKVSEVAMMLNVTDQTIYRWCKKGLIEYIRLPSGHLRIPRSQLVRLYVDYRLKRRRIGRKLYHLT